MPLLQNRPLATLSLIFIISLTAASLTSTAAKLSLSAMLVFFALLILILKKKRFLVARRPRFLTVILAVAVIGQIFGLASYDLPLLRHEAQSNKSVTVTGTVTDIVYQADFGAAFTLACDTLDGKECHITISVSCDTSTDELLIGDRLSLAGVFTPLIDARYGGTDKYLLADGIMARMQTDTAPTYLGKNQSLLLRTKSQMESYRDSLSARITDAVQGDAGKLMSAMLLGTRDLLPDAVTRDFRRLGISHILALSGLHLSILMVILHTASVWLRLPRRAELLISIAFLVFYIFLTGLTPSILRAGIMAAALSLSFFAARQADSVTSLFLAVTLILLFAPYAIYDCSLWLSFAATLGILIYSESSQGRAQARGVRRAWRLLQGNFLVGLSAFAATLAAISLFFGEISWIAPLANLFLVPLFSLYLIPAVPVLLLGNSLFLGDACSALGNTLLHLTAECAKLPHLLLDTRYLPFTVVMLLGTAALFLYLCFFRTSGKRLLLSTLLLIGISGITLAVCAHPVYTEDRFGYASASANGDLVLVTSQGNTLLYDATYGGSAVTETAEALLREAHATELSAYMLSHYHTRHTSTLARISASFMLRALYLPTPESEDEEALYRELCRMAENRGISVYRYLPYEEISFGDLTLIPHKSGTRKESTHKTTALTVKSPCTTLTYLGKGMAESSVAKTAASSVAISRHLIFGQHGITEHEKIAYPTFCGDLRHVLLPGGATRVENRLLSLLSARAEIRENTVPCLYPLN